MDLNTVLSELAARSGARLVCLAYQLTHDHAASEDLVQEAFVRMYASWRRREPEISNIDAYARRAVVNEFLRRRRLFAANEVVLAELPDAGVPSPDESVAQHDEVWRALGRLPARQRAVLVLRYYEDLPDPRIAELLGCREATVRSIAARAFAAVRSSSVIVEVVQ